MAKLAEWCGLAALMVALVAGGVAAAGEPAPAADLRRQVLLMLPLPPAHLRPGADYAGAWVDMMGQSARRRTASELARANDLTVLNDWPMPDVGVDCFVLAAPPGRSISEVAARLSKARGVAWAQPDNAFQTLGAAVEAGHNNPYYLGQPAAREWRLASLHKVATGRNVKVAVIDSRVDALHPSLVGQVDISENFVPDGFNSPELHGTAVAGIIAAKADDGIGIAGIAPGARLMALRACRQTPSPSQPEDATCDSLSVARALEFALGHHAQVVNMSLGGPPDPLLGKLVDVAQARGVAVVAAYDRDLPKGGFPASHAGVVAVADEDMTAPRGVYLAPGEDIPTTAPGGRYSLVSGSSFSAAHVSGLIALLRERSSAVRLAVRPGGEIIDACATVLGAAKICGAETAPSREVAATSRR